MKAIKCQLYHIKLRYWPGKIEMEISGRIGELLFGLHWGLFGN